jgi:bifunctional non-homologous end joining protein LigD
VAKSQTTRSAPSRSGSGIPSFIAPQLATLVSKPPSGDQWLHEIKFDGYRGEIAVGGGAAKFYTRRGNDWSDKFGKLMTAVTALKCRSALLDGELVALDEHGGSNFSMIQDAIGSGHTGQLVFFAFDLLHLNGKDLRVMALLDRKDALLKLISSSGQPTAIHYSAHIIGKGQEFFATSCQHDLEGIVSKRATAPYRSGRSGDWLKTKCTKRQEFVVGGWLPREGDPRDLAALLVGYYEGNKLLFTGRVGTGFTARTRADLIKQLSAREIANDPFEETPNEYRKRARWTEPHMVVAVDFTEFTDDGMIRHPTFRGVSATTRPIDVKLRVPRSIPEPGAVSQSRSRWRRSR